MHVVHHPAPGEREIYRTETFYRDRPAPLREIVIGAVVGSMVGSGLIISIVLAYLGLSQ